VGAFVEALETLLRKRGSNLQLCSLPCKKGIRKAPLTFLFDSQQKAVRVLRVVVKAEEYDRIQERTRFVAAVEEGLRQSEAGQVLSAAEADKELDREFGPIRKAKTK